MANPLIIPRVFGSAISPVPASNLDDDFNSIKNYLAPGVGFDNLSPMNAIGDIIVGDAAGHGVRLAAGATGMVLESKGPSALPAWDYVGGGGDTGLVLTGTGGAGPA